MVTLLILFLSLQVFAATPTTTKCNFTVVIGKHPYPAPFVVSSSIIIKPIGSLSITLPLEVNPVWEGNCGCNDFAYWTIYPSNSLVTTSDYSFTALTYTNLVVGQSTNFLDDYRCNGVSNYWISHAWDSNPNNWCANIAISNISFTVNYVFNCSGASINSLKIPNFSVVQKFSQSSTSTNFFSPQQCCCPVDTPKITVLSYPSGMIQSTSLQAFQLVYSNNKDLIIIASPTLATLAGEYKLQIYQQINGQPQINTTQTTIVTVKLATCAASMDNPTITSPTLNNQAYSWFQPAGSYAIPQFLVSSTLSICNASDIIYSMSVTGSVGGNTSFLSFNSTSMLMSWSDNTNRVSETFQIFIQAKITNLNGGSPFITTSSFQLVVTSSNCALSLDLPTITPPNLSDQVYNWTQPAGSYVIPLFTVSSILSICKASDIEYSMSVTGSLGGSTTFLSFNPTSMLISWFESSIRIAETFTVNLKAKIQNLDTTSPFENTSQFLLQATPICALSLDIPTITPPNLNDQIYNWTQSAGSYKIPQFTVTTTQYCDINDIVYQIQVSGSVNGSITFITFNSDYMLMNWYSAINRVAENFQIMITATIKTLSWQKTFQATTQFELVVNPPTCLQSLDVPQIIPPVLSNQKYFWNDTAGSYIIPKFYMPQTISCESTNLNYSMLITTLNGGNTSFITFNQYNMNISWYESIIRGNETFEIRILSTLTNMNPGSPFIAQSLFYLFVNQAAIIPINLYASHLNNQTYILGSYSNSSVLIDRFTVLYQSQDITDQEVVYQISIQSDHEENQFIQFEMEQMKIVWQTNNHSALGTYRIKVTGKVHNLTTGQNIEASFDFYLFVVLSNFNVTLNNTNLTVFEVNYIKAVEKGVLKGQFRVPKAKILKISRQYQVNISFSEQMYVPQEIQMFKWRNLTEDQEPPLKLSIKPSNYQNLRFLNFTYTIVNFTEQLLTLQIKFDNPLYVTMSIDDPDILQVNFTSEFFFSLMGQNLAENSTKLQSSLPWIIPYNLDQNTSLDVIILTVQLTLVVQFVISLLMGFILNHFWQLVETQQIIILLPMFNIRLPGNAV